MTRYDMIVRFAHAIADALPVRIKGFARSFNHRRTDFLRLVSDAYDDVVMVDGYRLPAGA